MVHRIDGDKLATSEQKVEAWKRFLSVVSEDNPQSIEDDEMRSYAKSRIEHWQSPKQPKKEKSDKLESVRKESPEYLYKKALSVYTTGQYGNAAIIFDSLVGYYPNHSLADNALYWIGECLYAEKNYKGAIQVFQKVLKNYPSGAKAPDSLLKISYCYLALGDRPNAKSFLNKVLKKYPYTPAGVKAGEMLKHFKN